MVRPPWHPPQPPSPQEVGQEPKRANTTGLLRLHPRPEGLQQLSIHNARSVHAGQQAQGIGRREGGDLAHGLARVVSARGW